MAGGRGRLFQGAGSLTCKTVKALREATLACTTEDSSGDQDPLMAKAKQSRAVGLPKEE